MPSVRFDTSRLIGSDQREKNPIDDLFDVLRRQRLPQKHQLMARKIDRQCSQARRYLLISPVRQPADNRLKEWLT
jgi:hypothetical protein